MENKKDFQNEIAAIEQAISRIENPETSVEDVLSQVQAALERIGKCKKFLQESEDKMNNIINLAKGQQ